MKQRLGLEPSNGNRRAGNAISKASFVAISMRSVFGQRAQVGVSLRR